MSRVSDPLDALRRWAPIGVAAMFVTSGVLHFVRPAMFVSVVPRRLPKKHEIVLVSGLAELLCAAGLLRGTRLAGLASAVLLVAIFPANVTFALDVASDPADRAVPAAVAWARLPLQVLLIWAALQSGRAQDTRARAAQDQWLRVRIPG
jgi:uncharacterized membrane protein